MIMRDKKKRMEKWNNKAQQAKDASGLSLYGLSLYGLGIYGLTLYGLILYSLTL